MKTLKIQKSIDPATGKRTYYYVEFRTPYGFDEGVLDYPNIQNGVVVHLGKEQEANTSFLLSMSRSLDPGLARGLSYTDAKAGVTINVISTASNGATVQVNLTPPLPCLRANPLLSISSVPEYNVPSTMLTYKLKITNNDQSTCGTSVFNLTKSLPSGWSGSLSATSATLKPGTSASFSIAVTSAMTAINGQYPFSVTATNGQATQYASQISANYNLARSLLVVVNTDKGSYLRGTKAVATATVSVNGVPVQGAAYTFTLTKPDGSIKIKHTKKSVNGVATRNIAIKGNALSGNYSLAVTAISGTTTGSGRIDFIVP